MLLDYVLERSYLESLSSVTELPKPASDPRDVTWVRIERLPVHPTYLEEYDLLSRWQSVLSTLHSWGHRLLFLLLRRAGKTHLYLGAVSLSGLMIPKDAAVQLGQAATSQMPGIALGSLDEQETIEAILKPMSHMGASGAVTGLPSPRKAPGYGLLQTLDQVAFGIRDLKQYESNYAVVVIAEPIADRQIADAIRVLRLLGSQIHTAVKRTGTMGGSRQRSSGAALNLGMVLGMLLSFIPSVPSFMTGITGPLFFPGLSFSRGEAISDTQSIATEYLDKTAEYCEQVTDRHIERLKKGRNLGFWNSGIYVLAPLQTTVVTVTGMLRAVYSGEESYLEPIRVHSLAGSSGAAEWIQQFEHIPFPTDANRAKISRDWTGRQEGWHPLGSMYESITTPLNTEELSLATSLPRRDVPGLRFVRNAVRFATNPPLLDDGADAITLGRVMDTGVSLGIEYAFDVNTLVQHALVTGITGSGKSTTCRRLLTEVIGRGLPTLVIEPAKDEYVSWAIKHNEAAPEAQRIQVYMPGVSAFDGTPVQPLLLNPFQPAGIGQVVDLASRCERFCAVLTASLPMTDVLPLLLEEAIYEYVHNQIDPDWADKDVVAPAIYPKLEGVIRIAQDMIEARGYEQRVKDNLKAAIATRIRALSRGRRGQILNTERSTPFAKLFDQPAVVNLSQITDDRDKALIMALLVTALFEYRSSKYRLDRDYKQRADDNRLCHLTIIEEAHRLLARPQTDYAGIGNPQAVVSGMFSEMLSEIRAYGQGLLVVDQVPARLIPDAIKNTNLKIVHRLVAHDDRAAMSSCMALRPDQEAMIAALRVGEAIVCSDHDDAAAWIQVKKL
jgi:hypothetical protein